MRTLIQNRDLKTLFSGVAVAATAGLLMGGAMYPNLDFDKVEGPQILMSGGGPRSSPHADYAGIGAYNGRVPDYVIGTDALKPARYEVLAYNDPAESEPAEAAEAQDVMAYEAPVEVQQVRWQDEPREASRYPSERGNTVYEADLPAPPEPPTADDDGPVAG